MNSELVIIANGFVSQSLYEIFALGWMETNDAPKMTIEEGNPDEEEFEYSITLYDGKAPNESIIWVFSDLNAYHHFDSVWLILRNYEDEKKRRILFYLNHLFKTKYYESESDEQFQGEMAKTLTRIKAERGN